MMRKETLSGSWLEQWRGFMASLRGFSEYGYEQMGVPQTNYDTDHQRFEKYLEKHPEHRADDVAGSE